MSKSDHGVLLIASSLRPIRAKTPGTETLTTREYQHELKDRTRTEDVECLWFTFKKKTHSTIGNCIPSKILYGEKLNMTRTGSEVIKLFSFSTQLSTKFQLLIKAKIPTNEDVYCFKSLICCIYHANKC